jgi:hypothetical protein
MDGGWIKLWRKTLDSAVFMDDELFKLWCLCLFKAGYKDKQVLFNKAPVDLKAGEFITGRDSLWYEFYTYKDENGKWHFKPKKSSKTVWNWLKTLEIMQNLTIKSSSKYSIISIMNWDRYQGNGEESFQEDFQDVSSRLPADFQQTSTNKNNKNIKNDKKKLTDEEFLLSLKEKFTWVDFDSVMVKMDAWLLAHPERHKTRKFIVNWLNKIEKPMETAKSKSW